ncbi:MarR family winged helix-turn-helix transcriptional regulator [Actinomarinicola tropica]|uniref:MarR family transcriptional regulator n=1 Tax=Actinomarinicola tropica TaxID=2789776 RepID=A0A5Q2RM11_9ACTN|nr:MarR family winged helix-turn-helix transcriptional regulator [Actinomarinicola tropica]QGG95127.1 MarR family transcriptional regulator [Actinomarinicola tropica]
MSPPAPSARPGTSSDDLASGAVPAAAGRAAARLARTVENALGGVDLSLPQYRMLVFLDDMGSSAASALAGRLGVSRPSVTALVDGLVARGFAERAADPADRRRVAHVITPKGRAALAAADEAVGRRLAELSSKISDPGARTSAVEGLVAWLDALNTEREAKLADS